MAHWLVQGNPGKWRVHELFADGNQLDSWSITRYRDECGRPHRRRQGHRPFLSCHSTAGGPTPSGRVGGETVPLSDLKELAVRVGGC